LKEPYDFSFISNYGKVFRVFDNSFSGAISFGVERSGRRYFLKFVGAKPWDATDWCVDNMEDAVMRLKFTAPKYKDLKHPLLVNQLYAEEAGGGYIAVYDWFDGEGCGYMHPEMQQRFLALPNSDKLRVYTGILTFHAHVIDCGYVAVDFNNGAALYNFDTGDFAICDIDFFAKQCHLNGYDGIWGDPSFKSPEEGRGGAVVDEVSNVFAMGAVAFYFFAENDKYARDKWTLGDGLYAVAKKAVSDRRADRQQTIREYIHDWNAAGATTL